MNGAHLHLLVNHVSLFALIFGVMALGMAMAWKSPHLRVLAVTLFVIAGVFSWIAVETGEKAEDVLKEARIEAKTLIDPHEAAADWAQRSGILIACLAIGMEIVARKKPQRLKALQWVVMVFAIHGITVFARTAYLGGQIRHTELRDAAPAEPK